MKHNTLLTEAKVARLMGYAWDAWVRFPRSTRALHVAEYIASETLKSMATHDAIEAVKKKK